MTDSRELFDRLEQLFAEIEALDESARAPVFEFLHGLELLHRSALHRLAGALGDDALDELRRADPAIAWLLEAYDVGVDDRAQAEAALDEIRPYIHSHGGSVELLGVADGVVRLRLAGSCSGCTASAITLREGVERALREGFRGFSRLEVEEDEAAPHPPPGATLLQIEDRLP